MIDAKKEYGRAWAKARRRPCIGCGKSISHRARKGLCLSCTKLGNQNGLNANVGANNGNWNGGKSRTNGYVVVRCPAANPWGYVLEHRLVMEAYLGRTLLPTEVVHHVNGVRDDNRIGNLKLFAGQADHRRRHGQFREIEERQE